MTLEKRAAMVVALQAHGTDRLSVAGLGRVHRNDSALVTAAIVSVWPAEADGTLKVALTDVAGFIAWRAFILAEIAAGRGKRSDIAGYCATLGVETREAYEYVCVAAKGHGVRPCADADHDDWSEGTGWVAFSGRSAEPRNRWARSAWARRANAHRSLAAAGLALPGQPTWCPVATCLFDEPAPVAPMHMLSPTDAAALMVIGA